MRPAIDGSPVNVPSALLWKKGAEDQQAISDITDAVERIQWALREVLPGRLPLQQT